MEKSRESLLAFLNDFDADQELYNLTKDEVRDWIIDEWSELQQDGISPEEATSIIIDGNYKWMSIKAENEKFVYETLLILNKFEENSTVIDFLKEEIKNAADQIDIEKKSKQLVR
ncbi:hypothetical protein [Bacillus cereus]|uniref:hypothetical protein n=1 Tax=Bacillus cereus TaxID=1396 RepID=UPI003B7C286B